MKNIVFMYHDDDAKWKEKICISFAGMRRQNLINIIEHADPSAFPILDIILILISPSLIANNTLVNAVNFAVANKWDGQCILGIRCRKANMERDLGRLAETQNLPRMGPPLSQCKSEDDALYLIAEEIRAIVE